MGIVRLEAQLHSGHPRACHTAHPLGVGHYGIQTQMLWAGGKLLGAGKVLQAKVLGLVRPLVGLCTASAKCASLPGAGQAFSVVGNKAQRTAGLQCSQVGGVL